MSKSRAPIHEGFASFVEEHLGFHAESPTSKDWNRLLAGRLEAAKLEDFAAYERRFAAGGARKAEVESLATSLTIGETYFFRDSRQFEALLTVVLPNLLRLRGPGAKVRVLSAACSTGEEPYSLAMVARELLGDAADRVEIVGFDVNPDAITAARRGSYSEWSLRATPTSVRRRYFQKAGSQHLLTPEIKDRVRLEVRNFFDKDDEFWRPEGFDVILCRNVLIYFTPRKIAAVLERLASCLAPDGSLFLGNAESPRGYHDGLVPHELCGTFCYRLSRAAPGPVTSFVPPRPPFALLSRTLPPATPASSDGGFEQATPTASDSAPWVSAIEAASHRLSTLVAASDASNLERSVESKEAAQNDDVAAALALCAEERFVDALTLLDRLVGEGSRERRVELLRASILTNQGRFAEARDLCSRILADHPHAAGAYHLLGVVAEHEGQRDEASQKYEMAVMLDPGFAMAFWLLGRLLLRSGQRERALRHLREALRLFERADEDVADPFAGGFGKDTLIRLCREDILRSEVRR